MLELLTCLAAVIVGLWLGAKWLDIDLQRTFYTAINDPKVLEKLPESIRPTVPDDIPTHEERLQASQGKLDRLKEEILSTANSSDKPAATNSESAVENQRLGEKTYAFWGQISNLVREEAQLHIQSHEKNGVPNFDLQARLASLTREVIEQLDPAGVDPRLVELSRKLADWYARSATLYRDGETLGVSTTARLDSDTTLRKWRLRKTQLDSESALLWEQAASLRALFTQRYQLQFSEFAGNEL